MKNLLLVFLLVSSYFFAWAKPSTHLSSTTVYPDFRILQECNIDDAKSCAAGSTCTAIWNAIQNRVQNTCVKRQDQIDQEKEYEWQSPPANMLSVNKGDYIVEFRFSKSLNKSETYQLHDDRPPFSAFKVIYKTAVEKKFIANLVRKTTASNPIHAIQSFAAYAGQASYNKALHFVLKPLLVSGAIFPEVCDGASDLYSEWAFLKLPDLGLQAVSPENRAPIFCPWLAQVYEIRADKNKLIWKTHSK